MSILSKIGKALGFQEQHITLASITQMFGVKTSLEDAKPDIESWIENEALAVSAEDNAKIADTIIADTGINVTPDVVIAILQKAETALVTYAVGKVDTLFDHSAATTAT